MKLDEFQIAELTKFADKATAADVEAALTQQQANQLFA